MKNVLFRCDASWSIGFGHLVRCLALACEFQKQGCQIAFAVNKNAFAINLIQKEKYAIYKKYTKNYKQWLSGIIEKFKADILILDVRDDLDEFTLGQIKQKFNVKIVTIDDPTNKRLACDFAFYPPIFQVKQLNWEGFRGKLYSGFEWVILRKQFLEYKNKPKKPNKKLKVFVNAGGSDPKCITPIIAKALGDLKVGFEAVIVIGALFSCKRKLEAVLKQANYEYKIFENVDNMAEIMHSCDFAVCSFGTSAYELAVLGVPAVYVCISKDHSLSASSLEEKGFAINLGEYDNLSQKVITKAALKLAENADLRYRMAQSAKSSVDGFGALRIAQEVLGEC
ncbi:N-Acetylneuraminate cytidylyltransferase [Desulfurella amilsii]|uniref:N-Acetylneuraminate cytidylyltransferase n=1 Tax=Desulfurella amilsii TaxID=1562698 RepID=A0A1X4XUH2_9BACT|nr:UDP-2,4-diacetamido-2,4,6-trideoxy-beta-L-altropyranose hydrolase [Desulfurella amilsii]OSS41187.1 N-Acetylneuraminate cytidylyltransferase [Desulfurella amilsii]